MTYSARTLCYKSKTNMFKYLLIKSCHCFVYLIFSNSHVSFELRQVFTSSLEVLGKLAGFQHHAFRNPPHKWKQNPDVPVHYAQTHILSSSIKPPR